MPCRVFNILDLPSCVLPVTKTDPAKDPKATGIQYFNEMDKTIHDQCEIDLRPKYVTLTEKVCYICDYSDDPEFGAGMPVAIQV